MRLFNHVLHCNFQVASRGDGASGEGSGRLDQMLERAAIQQERETQARLATLLSLLEPGLILFMGGIVTLIVLSIMLPVMGGMSNLMH